MRVRADSLRRHLTAKRERRFAHVKIVQSPLRVTGEKRN
jgi:hypothetical protein